MTAHVPFSSTAKSQMIATPVVAVSATIPARTSASIYFTRWIIGFGAAWLLGFIMGANLP